MKKYIIITVATLCPGIIISQENYDSTVNQLEKSVKMLQYKNRQLENSVVELRGLLKEQSLSKDSLQDVVNKNADENKMKQQKLKTSIDNSIKEQSELKSSIGVRTIILIVVALLLSAIVFYFLKKRINKSNSSISKLDNSVSKLDKMQEESQKIQQSLQEESLKLDSKLLEILEKQLSIENNVANNETKQEKEIDHSLTLKVADEVTRIEYNLSKMDASVRGYKQLSAAIRRIKDNFSANGYEIVDMLGKPYNEGMKTTADFVVDENLKAGEQIITKVIKPQVNYNGVMIQASQIQVSQGE